MSSISTPSKTRRYLSYLFGLRDPVARKPYAIIGFSLITLKYLVDAAAVYAWTGRFWSPVSYLAPFLTLHLDVLRGKEWIALAMAIWTLPFLWIGLSLTFRRAIDAGLPRWWGLLFLVPVINYLVMLDLCLRPSRAESRPLSASTASDRRIESALLGLAAPPTELLFQVGVAFPQRARIHGQGVGAVRHCEFSTGSFVEPITGWEPPSRLSFDVNAQPAPMNEWSPYRQIMPPHLEHHFRSKRGEFRIIGLSGDRARLEGTTWYELDFFPLPYWRLWADSIVHAIHQRVLQHIRSVSES